MTMELEPFPEVSQEHLDRVADGTSISNNPSLKRSLEKIAAYYIDGDDVTEFNKGAVFVSSVLDSNLPRVNRVVARRYERECMGYLDQLLVRLESLDFAQSPEDKLEKLAQAEHAISSDFSLMRQLDECLRENRPLVMFLCTRSPAFSMGGLVVYGLKREQFLARHLEKSFPKSR